MEKFNQGTYSILITDDETGEVQVIDHIKNPSIMSEEEVQRNKKYNKMKAQQEEGEYLSDKWQKQRGDFVWYKYTIGIKPELQEQLEPANVARLMFLATYLDYMQDEHGGNILTLDGSPMNKREITFLLHLSYYKGRKFFDEMTANGILYQPSESEDTWSLNSEIFMRGSLTDQIKKDLSEQSKTIIRLYIDGIRKIYSKVNEKRHAYLGYIFKLIPYINRRYNIICKNPFETDLDSIIPMRLSECCEIIGFDQHHYDRVFNALFSIVVTIDGKDQVIMNCVSNASDSMHKGDYRIFINPNVYYAGNYKDWCRVEVLGKFSEVRKKKKKEV